MSNKKLRSLNARWLALPLVGVAFATTVGAQAQYPEGSIAKSGNGGAPLVVDSSNGLVYTIMGNSLTSFDPRVGSSSVNSLYSFTYQNIASGYIALDSQGNLFGTTLNTTNTGMPVSESLYEMQRTGGAFGAPVTLATLPLPAGNAYLADGGLSFDKFGNMYGVLSTGGNGSGSIFEIRNYAHAAQYVDLYDFPADQSQTAGPLGALNVISNSNGTVSIFGATAGNYTTYTGSSELFTTTAFNPGTAGTNSLNVQAILGSTGSVDNYEAGMVLNSSGSLIGISNGGGAYGVGEIYAVNTQTDALSTLYSFNGGDGINGSSSSLPLIDSHGHILGISRFGGDNGTGFAWSYDPAQGVLTNLQSFGVSGTNTDIGTDPLYYASGLVEYNSPLGTAYIGTTNQDGLYGYGSFYLVTTPEPGTTGLAIAGLFSAGGVLLRRRRARK
jgi:uncharacterized repeat protein (TIGR03803 family)